MEVVAWLATTLVVAGYLINSWHYRVPALIVWILADIGWILYDIHISNPSHAVLATCVIVINIFGLYNSKCNGKSERRDRPVLPFGQSSNS